MKNILLLFTVLFLAISCQQKEKGFSEEETTTQETAKKEAMAVHNEIMGSWLHLQDLSDSLKKLVPTYEDKKETSDAIDFAITAADGGVTAMRDWMKNYNGSKAEEKNITHEEVTAYYKNQKAKAEVMKKAMEKGLTMAEDFLNKYGVKNDESNN